MGRLGQLKILVTLAWRNLYCHKGKNAVVGLLLLLGTFLVVLGTSLLDSIERAMTRSVVKSVAGHLQVYNESARDDLALFGSSFMGEADIGSIPDFQRVKQVLATVPNVKAIVPMGSDTAEFYTATQLDRAVELLRRAQERGDAAKIGTQVRQIRGLAELMAQEFDNRRKVVKDSAEVEKQMADIGRVLADDFWEGLRTAPEQVIEFLDTKIAPLVDEGEMYFLRYLGTDLALFAQNFDTFEVVRGSMVPQGARGLLLSQKFYDDFLRNPVARGLDNLRQAVVEKGKTISRDPLLQNEVDRLVRQYRRITFQLEPDQATTLATRLRELLPGVEGSLDELIQAFLRVDDRTLLDRHKFFFEEIAPKIQLYLFEIGDVITIRAFTRSGYLKSVNLKVYGTFSFRGLERSDLAGAFNLLDMLTFRDLYGMMTTEKLDELRAIRKEVGLAQVDAGQAEGAFFGADRAVEAKSADKDGFDEFAGTDLKQATPDEKSVNGRPYDQEAIDRGMALNAAIILEDPDRLDQTRAALEQAIAKNGLGLRVVDWQAASGIVGQMVVLVRVVLYVAIFIIFLVALVIINNTMVMATMERMIEIGTVRAIGGQRRFVMTLFLLETMLLGLLAGALGALLGAGVISHLGRTGIPAVADVLVFLFSGPRLYPAVDVGNLVGAGVVILLVSLVATFYPAFIATRIQPIVAMQARE